MELILECPRCNKTGFITCPVCKGGGCRWCCESGKVPCSRCLGQGRETMRIDSLDELKLITLNDGPKVAMLQIEVGEFEKKEK